MSTRIESLWEQLAQFRRGSSGQGTRYPEELRTAAALLAVEELEAGESMTAVAQQLGIAGVTLERWMAAMPASGFRQVQVIETSSLEADAVRILTLVTPNGYRIEGLDPAQAIELVVRLDARQ